MRVSQRAPPISMYLSRCSCVFGRQLTGLGRGGAGGLPGLRLASVMTAAQDKAELQKQLTQNQITDAEFDAVARRKYLTH